MTMHYTLNLGTRVAILEDVFGEHATTGIVAGYTHYNRPDASGIVDCGYVIHLDHGFYGGDDSKPIGLRPYIGTIVAHEDSVTPTNHNERN